MDAPSDGETDPVVLSGQALLPPGVPAKHVYVLVHGKHNRDHDHNAIFAGRLPTDDDGRFKVSDWWEEPGAPYGIEVVIAHEGQRWYGYAGGTLPARGLRIQVRDVRPGELALVRTSVRTEAGEALEPRAQLQLDSDIDVSHGYDLGDSEDEGVTFFLWRPETRIYGLSSPWNGQYADVSVGPLPSSTTDITFVHGPGREVRGRLMAPDGSGMSDAKVVAKIDLGLERPPLHGGEHDATTDAEGRFTLKGLGPYRYTVSIRTKSDEHVVSPTTLAPTDTTLALTARANKAVDVTVLDAQGEPVEEASVRLRSAPHGLHLAKEPAQLNKAWWIEWDEGPTVTTDDKGVARLRGLDPERAYVLDVFARARPELEYVSRSGWRPRDVTVRLRSGLTIRGRALTADGEPVSDAYIEARAVDGSPSVSKTLPNLDGTTREQDLSRYVTVEDQGSFEIGPFPPGRYALRLAGGQEVVAEAGTRGVVLRGGSPWDQVWAEVQVDGWRAGDQGAYALLGRQGGRIRALPVGPGGKVRFPHVGTHTNYDLWIGGLEKGRYVWLRDFVMRTETDFVVLDRGGDPTITVTPKAGGTIRGRVAASDGVRLETWTLDPVGALIRAGRHGGSLGGLPVLRGADAQSFEIRGVPPGTWTLRATASVDGVDYVGEVAAEPGGYVAIELAPR